MCGHPAHQHQDFREREYNGLKWRHVPADSQASSPSAGPNCGHCTPGWQALGAGATVAGLDEGPVVACGFGKASTFTEVVLYAEEC